MIRLRFENSNDSLIYVQIDPFAAVYALEKGQAIEIEADGSVERPDLTIDEHNDTRIVTLNNYDDFFVILDDKRVHWTEYQTNMDR